MTAQFWMQFGLGMAALAVVIAGGVLLISRIANGDGSPDDAQRKFLTAAAGETILEWHVCNALVMDAGTDFFSGMVEDGARYKEHVPGAGAGQVVLTLAKAWSGGHWIGGTAVLTSHRIAFMPNWLSKAMVRNISTVSVDLDGVRTIEVHESLLQKQIALQTPDGVLNLRFRAAHVFAESVRRQMTAATGRAADAGSGAGPT